MACTASALQCPLRQFSNAQASCSARTTHAARLQREDTTCKAVAGVRHGSRHQHRLPQGSLHPIQRSRCAASDPDTPAEAIGDTEDDIVLTKEEDWTVPGGANDSLSSNTQLGRAVQDACSELETLGGLEQETIEKANVLLQKLGYRVLEKQDQDHVAQD